MLPRPSDLRTEIRETLAVTSTIVVEHEIRARIEFLKRYLLASGARGLIIGVSGGQDSALTGRLAQIAVEELNAVGGGGRSFTMVALRLPYGVQADEADAQVALDFIRPDRRLVVDVKPAVDAAVAAVERALGGPLSDFVRGNVKARERMVAQYAIAGQEGLLVVGTDHAAEAVTGFFTKFGDGAVDVIPISGLTKRQGRMLLAALGAPPLLSEKTPTADLEDDRPGRSDEDALGLRYEQIDDYLEGRPVEEAVARRLEEIYRQTEHKRRQPVAPDDSWWELTS